MGRRRRGEGGELCVYIGVGLGVVSGICAFDGGVGGCLGGCLGSWFRVRGEGRGWDGMGWEGGVGFMYMVVWWVCVVLDDGWGLNT